MGSVATVASFLGLSTCGGYCHTFWKPIFQPSVHAAVNREGGGGVWVGGRGVEVAGADVGGPLSADPSDIRSPCGDGHSGPYRIVWQDAAAPGRRRVDPPFRRTRKVGTFGEGAVLRGRRAAGRDHRHTSHSTQEGTAVRVQLDSLTGAYPIASHESGSDHNVFFKTQRPYEDTIAVVFADREGAERFRNAVSAAVPRR